MNWLKQSISKPLFEDFLWNQPINNFLGPKICLVGGNLNGFKLMAEAYQYLEKQNYQQLFMIMPDSLKRFFNHHDPRIVFAHSNQSGSLSTESLGLIEEISLNSDILSLIGNFSHNSETTILIDKIIQKISKAKILSDDAIIPNLKPTKNQKIILIIDFLNLQNLIKNSTFNLAITSKLDIMNFCQIVSQFCDQFNVSLITFFQNQLIAFYQDQISLTEYSGQFNIVQLNILSSIYLSNNDQLVFESLTSAIYSYINDGAARRT